MTELSQTVKNFLGEFERNIIPHFNKAEASSLVGGQPITCYVSASTLMDPQLKELLGIKPGSPEGKFMGVVVKGKPDMTFETNYEEKT